MFFREPFTVTRSKENNFSIENADLHVGFSTISGTMKVRIFREINLIHFVIDCISTLQYMRWRAENTQKLALYN